MYKIVQIGKLPNLNVYIDYLDAAANLEIVHHKYGNSINVPDYPCWMEYQIDSEGSGSISFTRHTCKHPVLKYMAENIVQYLSTVFKGIVFEERRVHFLRTIGNIPPHVDESGRICCINIGLKNSNTATTYMSNDGILENFEINNTRYILEDGGVYLVNTANIHAVRSDYEDYRYLITYGFGTPVKNLINCLKSKV